MDAVRAAGGADGQKYVGLLLAGRDAKEGTSKRTVSAVSAADEDERGGSQDESRQRWRQSPQGQSGQEEANPQCCPDHPQYCGPHQNLA
jgi:hypothetical protein